MDPGPLGWLTHIFQVNRVLVYTSYGLVFILMGVGIAVQSMKHTRLALGKHLWLLAVFGITHGFNEWGDVFIPIQAAYVRPSWITLLEFAQLGLLLVSFCFLLLFACNLLLAPSGPHLPMLLTVILASTAAILSIGSELMSPDPSPQHLLITGEVWTRYLVGFPAALGTALALYSQALHVETQAMPHIARWLRTAAWAFGVYSVLTGVATPTHDALLATWVNQNAFEEMIGISLPLLRALPAAVVAFNIIRSLHVFQIETERLLEEARQEKLLVAERELAAMSDIAVALGRSRSPGTVPVDVLRRMLDLLKLPDGTALLINAAGKRIAEIGDASLPFGSATCEELLKSARGGQVISGPQDGCNSWIGIPVMANQHLLGMLALSGPGPVIRSEQEDQVLISIGNQIGTALENFRLWEEIQRKEAVRSELLNRVIGAQEEERIRVARELHDELGQTLNGLSIRVGAAIHALPADATRARWILEGNRELLSDGIRDLRSMVYRLRPAALDDLGLVPALRHIGRQFGNDCGFRLLLRSRGLSARLPRALETTLFRVSQEALSNVAKHAEATFVSVNLTVNEQSVGLAVADNGKGFAADPVLNQGNGHSFGLLGMQERVALVGGTLWIKSEPGRGTRVLVRVPLIRGGLRDEKSDADSTGG